MALKVINPKLSGVKSRANALKCVDKMYDSIRIDPSKYDFIDFGSGKGGVVKHMTKYNFNRIIGIEINKELHDISKKKLNYKRVELVNTDITKYEYMSHKGIVLYMYEPLWDVEKQLAEKIYNLVFDKITQYCKDKKLLVVYVTGSKLRGRLLNEDFFKKYSLKVVASDKIINIKHLWENDVLILSNQN